MTMDKIRTDFDRLAQFDDDGWTHNNHYIPFLLRHMPSPCSESVEIGCGAGLLARQMAQRSTHVLALDLSPQMIAVAQSRSGDYPNITYEVGDVLARTFPAQSVDCIVSVATLHHIPMHVVLPKIKDLLKPGGVLLVLDLYRGEGLTDLLRSAIAAPAGAAMKLIKNGRPRVSREESAAWEEHGRTDHYLSVSGVRHDCRIFLPGAVIRKHLFWRYSIVWVKP